MVEKYENENFIRADYTLEGVDIIRQMGEGAILINVVREINMSYEKLLCSFFSMKLQRIFDFRSQILLIASESS